MSVLFVIVPDGFRDEEYAVPKQILEDAGFAVTTASSAPGCLRGKRGLVTAQVDITLNKVKASDYQGILIVGGQDTYWYDPTVLRLVKEFYEAGKLTAAICISGAIPAQAGIMTGKELTVFPEPRAIADIQKNGGIYVSRPVVISGNVITAADADAAAEFGRALAAFLQK